MAEGAYKTKLRKRIEGMFADCVVLINDPSHLQGVPDMLVLHGPHWAMLEVKMSADAERQPNQPYYVEMFDRMSFAAFIHPGNEEEVLNELQLTFCNRR